ncbi:hypothetical protein A5747_00280 [Mycobacterium sp. IS-836]|uniref:hypothetical protein n=1 Tax=Mycobacterium sp. IS-836 TaxID=1834160 RepID=UPI00096BF179|nr:hypothetical protein [Mycobacterium sp. IS-836]OMC55801.1 hypothetical protein A5747_00280 [Mycobacterium sp. IS-836]
MSAAINETLPIIESPVTDGLPAVQAALKKTGSSIAAAAAIYADTDSRLGDNLTQVQFLAAGEKPESAPPDKPEDGKKPSPPKPAPQPGTSMPQPGQLAGAAGSLGSVMQGMQGAMGSMAGGGPKPAQLADSNKKDPSSADEEKQQPGPDAEGAAPGAEASENAPVEAPTSGQPHAAPAEITL